MSNIQKSIYQITSLEDLAQKDTPLHKMNVSVKLIITLFYIITVVSFPPMQINGLFICACFPILLMFIGEIPVKTLLARCMLALPFAIFAGLSNLILDRRVYLELEGIYISKGMITLTSLLIKTMLTVMAVFLFMASTKMNDMIYALLSLHLPSLIVIQIMMTYRYMSVLLREASLMHQAYLLRAPGEKGIKLMDMGSFLGQLILRSIDRAERIYHSMQCRGFEGQIHLSDRKVIGVKGWLFITIAVVILFLIRIGNPGESLGRLLLG